jgi:hypothetical protein
VARRFTEVTDSQAKKTLARRFIGLADSLRDLLTRFGLRSYKVTIVRVEWTGGRRGRGVPVVLSEKVILPTPKISNLDALTEVVQSVGLAEMGSIELSQISGTFTEEDLLGTSADGSPIPPNQEFFYEVEFYPHDGPPQRRRFFPASAPTYMPGRLQWSIRLEKSNEDRARNGDAEN